MSEASLLARLHDRPGALERAIGLIRRRAHSVHRISVASARDTARADADPNATDQELGEPPLSEPRPNARRSYPAVSHLRSAAGKDQAIIELVLRVDESRTPRDRVRRDLLGLVDLIDVRDLDDDTAETRELLLAWIRSDAASQTTGSGRIVAVSGAHSLLEVTGTPAEIDKILNRLDEIDAVITTVRSGEVAAPAPMPTMRHGTGFDDVRDVLSANSHNHSSRGASILPADELSAKFDKREPRPATRNSELGTRNSELGTRKGTMTEARVFNEQDADLAALAARTIAVIGYGSQGRAHALNLRDSGLDVVIGLRDGAPSATLARDDGFEVRTVPDAVAGAGLIAVLIPDTAQAAVYAAEIAPHREPGSALLFAHGFNVHYGQIDPPGDADVLLVAPKSPGAMVRGEYAAGRGVPALIAVHRDVSGRAHALALAYAHALGATRAGVLETTFQAETETDLFGEQAVLCGGVTSLVKAGFDTLVDAGYSPELAYFECLHELKLIVDLMYAGGLEGMRRRVSDTAEYGDYTSGPRVIGDPVRKAMGEVLEDIRSGRFARQWIAEMERGGPEFKRLREAEREHGLETVGRALRERMAWLNPEAQRDRAQAQAVPANAE